MMTAAPYCHELYKGSKKYVCPGCGRKTFNPYQNTSTKEFIADHVGRCDRENECRYHYTPKEYFQENGIKRDFKPVLPTPEPIKHIDYLPLNIVDKSTALDLYRSNNLVKFMVSKWGKEPVLNLVKEYLIGTNQYWLGACQFNQIDINGNLRQTKIILHDKTTGKRVKEGCEVKKYDKASGSYITEVTEDPCSKVNGRFIDESTRNLNLQQCFFGEHLITEYPDKKICVVESEKTALIAAIYLPEFTWIATGGASGCKWRDYEVYKVLKNKEVTFFPDYGYFKTGKTCFQEWSDRVERIKDVLQSKIRVSDAIEKYFDGKQREDQDIADILIHNNTTPTPQI